MVAIFGGVTRSGKWRVRKNIQALALFGGMDLDLRDAIFEAPVVEISGFWCFGGLDIKVPEGIEVRDQTAGIFGGTDVRDIGDPAPGAPTLVIKGVTCSAAYRYMGPSRVSGGNEHQFSRTARRSRRTVALAAARSLNLLWKNCLRRRRTSGNGSRRSTALCAS